MAQKHYYGVARGISEELKTLEAAMGVEGQVAEIIELLKTRQRVLAGERALPDWLCEERRPDNETAAARLRAARAHAGLTQKALARRIRKSQATISKAEAGRVGVTEELEQTVLSACRLPPDWRPPTFT